MKLRKSTLKFLVAWVAATAPLMAYASYSDSFSIPATDASARVGALMPYTRYDSRAAQLGGGARIEASGSVDVKNVASQASERSYVSLPSAGAYAEWTVDAPGDGVTMRFTMPDSADGMGCDGSLDVYINGTKDQTVKLTSYYMYQYFSFYSGTPSDTPNGQIPCFAFDEVHFKLNKALNVGDKIKVVSTGANGLAYGVDFIEVESIPAAIGRPDGSLSVTDFGAVANDGRDDFGAFQQAMAAASAQRKTLYIPAGTFELSGMWHVYGTGIKITGAGIWHTNLKFTNPNQAGGGISGGSGASVCDCVNVEICHMYINSSLRSRYNENAIYKCFMDVFAGGSVIHDIWEDHFECGFWIADYNGSMEYSDNLKIINCRIRNNLADGVNFCQGTSHAAVYNCSIRNCGDDGLAMWNNDHAGAKDESGNIFAYNTIDLIWRAGGIAIYGGDGHKIYNNYIRDMFMASGIHLNTTFPGYGFRNTKAITFDNNILVGTGTEADCWKEDLAGIDLKQSVKNVTFNNTQIYDSPAYAMRLFSGPENINFNNTTILGAGKAEPIIEYSCVRHSACAIRLQNNNIRFSGVTIGGVTPDKLGNNSTWPIWTDNNAALAASVGHKYTNSGYTVPGYPNADSIQTGGITGGDDPGDDPWPQPNQYEKWYIGLGYGGNSWQEESLEVHPDADGVAVFSAIMNLGEYFRIRMYDGNTNTAYTLYGPEIERAGQWVASSRYADTSDGAFRITNPLLINHVIITVDVPNNKVKLTRPDGAQTVAFGVCYDNSQSRWNMVRAHIWDANSGASCDVDLQLLGGDLWHCWTNLAYTPTNLLFFNGDWGGSNQTPDFDYHKGATYNYNGVTSGSATIMTDDAVAPVYYDLQGVEVANPVAGNLYIVRRGAKITKEIAR